MSEKLANLMCSGKVKLFFIIGSTSAKLCTCYGRERTEGYHVGPLVETDRMSILHVHSGNKVT